MEAFYYTLEMVDRVGNWAPMTCGMIVWIVDIGRSSRPTGMPLKPSWVRCTSCQEAF